MVVVSASRQKSRRISHALRDRESQYITIKGNCTVKIGYLQVDMTDPRLRVNRFHGGQTKAKQKRCEEFVVSIWIRCRHSSYPRYKYRFLCVCCDVTHYNRTE